MEDRPHLGAMTPLHIVGDVAVSVALYRRMGFALLHQEEGFAMLARIEIDGGGFRSAFDRRSGIRRR